jgi:hypothetical protein
MPPPPGKRPTVPQVVPLVRAFYLFDGNVSGGHLHIVLDEGNIEDGHVKFCIEQARNAGDISGVLLGRVLNQMSDTQRGKVAATHGAHGQKPLSVASFRARCMALLLASES